MYYEFNSSDLKFITLVSMSGHSIDILSTVIKDLKFGELGICFKEDSIEFSCYCCMSFVLVLDKKQIKRTIVNDIQHLQEIVGCILTYKDGLEEDYELPIRHNEDPINLLQKIEIDEDTIRISVVVPTE